MCGSPWLDRAFSHKNCVCCPCCGWTLQEWRYTSQPGHRWRLPRHPRAPHCCFSYYWRRPSYIPLLLGHTLCRSIGFQEARAGNCPVFTWVPAWPILLLGYSYGSLYSFCLGTRHFHSSYRGHYPTLQETTWRLCWWRARVFRHNNDTHGNDEGHNAQPIVRSTCLGAWDTRCGNRGEMHNPFFLTRATLGVEPLEFTVWISGEGNVWACVCCHKEKSGCCARLPAERSQRWVAD